MRILTIIAAFTFASCSSYIQVMDTQTTNCKTESDTHFFENDSIKVTYNFWGLHGNMAFSVFNKTDKPLYVNWKNSSFIVNGEKYDYWSEIENTQTSAVTTGYSISGRLALNPRYGASNSASATSAQSVTTKPEKVTFIPPKSSAKKITFYLVPQDQFTLSSKKVKLEEPLTDSPKRKAKVEMETFTKENSPLVWRNYLAISGSEDATSFWFIDNEFYLTTIRQMTMQHFTGRPTGYENNEPVYNRREKNSKSFYLYIYSDATSFFKIK